MKRIYGSVWVGEIYSMNVENGTFWLIVTTFISLVVEVTCLLSVLSAPSVSSPVDCPGDALVFFRSLLDLHWISVSRPASSDEGFTLFNTTELFIQQPHNAVINAHFHLSWDQILPASNIGIGLNLWISNVVLSFLLLIFKRHIKTYCKILFCNMFSLSVNNVSFFHL